MMSFMIGLMAMATAVYACYTFLFIKGLVNSTPGSTIEGTPSVAVIVAARNEEQALPTLLDDLLSQDYSGSFEVYIANDRSTDSTGQTLDHFARKQPHFHPVHIARTSSNMTPKKHALTECIRQTTADIILATDADCRISPGWISSAVRHLDAETGIVVGYTEVQSQSLFASYQALDYIGIVVSNAGMMTQGKAWSGSGANLAYRRSAFTAINGFNPVADKISGDDFYLVQTIPAKTGLKARFNFDPAHFVTTNPTPTIGSFLTQRIRWSSNSRGLEKSDPLFFAFLVSAFLTNFTILMAVIFGWLGFIFWLCLSLKFVVEALVMVAGARRFQYWRLLWLFPLWFVLQPLYISFVGLMGLRGKYRWKT